MALVKGPNGLVYDWPESVAAGLLVKPDHKRVEKSEPDKAEEKPKRRTSTKAKK